MRVQRLARGKGLEALGGELERARDWERHAGRDEESGWLAAVEAREWDRVTDLVRTQEWPAYDADRDVQAQAWIAEREALLLARREQEERLERDRWEQGQELELYVRLPGPASRRLKALARELGVSPEQVVVLLAEHVEAAAAGLVHVPAVAVLPPAVPSAEATPWL
ncbi:MULTISPECIES: hypothetical protein [Streptacidiphilus]|uniref:Uncharacterized protein n=1 Tax=Streptacidiphilus cavernicola TaxID=3342716 RepID=A0ABV6UWD5_9ACTN|nr:hypothetical protein [Streptacidiphilus jeojiense]